MRDFDVKKQQISDRVDILTLASEHVKLRRTGKRWVGLCPFHTEKTPSFTVNPELGLFKCFGCGKGGDVFTFVQTRENVPFIEALHMLADRAGVELTASPSTDAGGPTRADLAKANDWAARYFQRNLRDEAAGANTREYLRDRGFTDAVVERFGLGLALDGGNALQESATRSGMDRSLLLEADLVRQSEDGRAYDTFRHRLIFPIRDAMQRVVGFGGRTLGDDRAKYLNTRQTSLFDKGRTLYGIDLARGAISERGRAIVVEGYTDCLAVHQAGFTEVVATLGTALTDTHVDLLRRYAEEVVFLFDSDEAGEAASDRAIRTALPKCVRARLARIPDGKDPSEFLCRAGADAFSDVLNRAIDALEFKWTQTQSRFEGDTSDAGRRDALMDFLRLIAEAVDTQAVDAIQRGLLVNQVAHLLRMDHLEVNRLLVRLRPRRPSREGGSSGPAEPRPGRSPDDAEQVAWARVIEVLLCEPGLASCVEVWPDAERIADPRDRRIVLAIRTLHEELGEFRPSDVVTRCLEAGDAERVTELAVRGEARKNYARTLDFALGQIRQADDSRVLSERTRRMFSSSRGMSDEGGEDSEAIRADLKQHRHFAPRRMLHHKTIPTAPRDGAVDETATAWERQ